MPASSSVQATYIGTHFKLLVSADLSCANSLLNPLLNLLPNSFAEPIAEPIAKLIAAQTGRNQRNVILLLELGISKI